MPVPPSVAPPVAPPQPAWTDPLLASPHTVKDKAARVNQMFSAIAPSYDLNNRLHSLWMDQHWRNVAVKMADVTFRDFLIVDVACGTGDLTLKFAQAVDPYFNRPKTGPNLQAYPPCEVLGIDFTYEMLPIAREKAARQIKNQKSKMPTPMTFLQGDAMSLPLANASVDILSIAFGIRNVSDWGKAIDEFARVLKPGGRLIVLEFSLPTNPFMRAFYNFYFRRIMPHTATWISGDKSGAYKYLPQSVNTFISRQAMQDRMQSAGFSNIAARVMTFGVCVCYKGIKI